MNGPNSPPRNPPPWDVYICGTITYGGMPARTAEQAAFFETQNQTFTQKPDWQVAVDSIQFADQPNFESFMPKYNETLKILNTYLSKWTTTPGLDMDQEITKLQNEIQATWNS